MKPDDADQGFFEIANIADTADGLDRLIRDKDAYWPFAVFGSALLQKWNKLQVEVHQHRAGRVPPSGERITTVDQLQELASDTMTEVQSRVNAIDRYLRSPAFTSLFDSHDVDPAAVIGAAEKIIDFYAANLRLARRVRGVSAPDRFAAVLEDTAHLVDRSLEGVDRCVTEYVGTVALLPSVVFRAGGDELCYDIPFTLHMDNALLARIVARLHRLRHHYFRAAKWGAISAMARTSLGNRLGDRWLGGA